MIDLFLQGEEIPRHLLIGSEAVASTLGREYPLYIPFKSYGGYRIGKDVLTEYLRDNERGAQQTYTGCSAEQ